MAEQRFCKAKVWGFKSSLRLMNQAIWVLVNCNDVKEAEKIGQKILKMRQCSCFDIIPRHSAVFYWPPKSGEIEKAKGAILILETFRGKYNLIKKEVKKLHSDKLPFIGFTEIKGLDKEYVKWMKGELRKGAKKTKFSS